MIDREDLKILIRVEEMLADMLTPLDDHSTNKDTEKHMLFNDYWNVVEKINNYQWEIYKTMREDFKKEKESREC